MSASFGQDNNTKDNYTETERSSTDPDKSKTSYHLDFALASYTRRRLGSSLDRSPKLISLNGDQLSARLTNRFVFSSCWLPSMINGSSISPGFLQSFLNLVKSARDYLAWSTPVLIEGTSTLPAVLVLKHKNNRRCSTRVQCDSVACPTDPRWDGHGWQSRKWRDEHRALTRPVIWVEFDWKRYSTIWSSHLFSCLPWSKISISSALVVNSD